jgi:hypothetical protein
VRTRPREEEEKHTHTERERAYQKGWSSRRDHSRWWCWMEEAKRKSSSHTDWFCAMAMRHCGARKEKENGG